MAFQKETFTLVAISALGGKDKDARGNKTKDNWMVSKLKPIIKENGLKFFKGKPMFLNESFLFGNNSKYQKM